MLTPTPAPDLTMSSSDNSRPQYPLDVDLVRVAVHICENCIAGAPGQCHVPGCLFCRWNIEDTPQPLKYLTQRFPTVDQMQIVVRNAVKVLRADHKDCAHTSGCPWPLMWDEDVAELAR